MSSFPDFVNNARSWITHLGNLGAPLAGVALANDLVVQRQRLDVEGLFDPHGRYRYLSGVSVPAVIAVSIGIAAYYAVPAGWVRLVRSLSFGAGAYLILADLRGAMRADASATVTPPTSPS